MDIKTLWCEFKITIEQFRPKILNSKIEDSEIEGSEIEGCEIEDSEIEDSEIEDSEIEDSKIEDCYILNIGFGLHLVILLFDVIMVLGHELGINFVSYFVSGLDKWPKNNHYLDLALPSL